MKKALLIIAAFASIAACSGNNESLPRTTLDAPLRAPEAGVRIREASTDTTESTDAYDPAAGTQPYFPASAGDPLEKTIPSAPAVNSKSASWTSAIASAGPFAFNGFKAFSSEVTPTNRQTDDLSWPLYLNNQGSKSAVTIHCLDDKEYGASCNTEGEKVYIDDREVPEDGGCPTATPSGSFPSCSVDAHWGLIDPSAGYEYWLWKARWPPVNGVLTVSYGGRCSLSGNGFSVAGYDGPSYTAGCVGDAAGVPGSLGLVRVSDIMYAIAHGGVLPGAISTIFGCTGETSSGTLPAPFLGPGDGKCTNVPPEGTRFFLNMTDAQVNALKLPAISSVLLRTMDKQHYGAVWVDNGGASPEHPSAGLALEVESDSTYEAWGKAGPLYSTLLPEARKEGIETYSITGGTGFPIAVPANFSWKNFAFCATSTC